MARRGLLIVVLLAWPGIGAPVAQPAAADEALGRIGVRGEVSRTARRLDAADKLAADNKWTDALDEYQHILDEAGDDLVPLGPGTARHSVQARWLCHLRIAALPGDALRLYRTRADEQAKKWLEQGMATRDPRLLRRILDETFCSRPTAQALDLLGDLAFERGRFDDAEYWWRMLAGPGVPRPKDDKKPPIFLPPPTPFLLVFPDPPQERADRAQAKVLLARLFRGERSAVATELKAFRQQYGPAHGHLAGRQGNYADILQALADRPDLLADPPESEWWTTFAASPTRNAVLPRAPGPALWRDGWQWCFDLEKRVRLAGDDAGSVPRLPPSQGKVLPPAQAARSLAFHPVLVGDWALVADARYLTAYDLRTGAPEVWYEFDSFRGEPKVPAEPDLRYTLTVADGRVYARMGLQGVRPGQEGAEPNRESVLVCLALKATGNHRHLWHDTLRRGEDGVFEGAPVAGAGRVYIAATRFEKGQAVTSVRCYDAGRGGRPLWQQDVCDTAEPRLGESRYRHHLLTLAGPHVVYCSHAGALIALDGLTGRRSWAMRYPGRADRSDDDPPPRDLAPCVYADGRLYAAPTDSDRLFCLEPTTGRLLWERDRLEVVHLLGIANGRLIFTTTAGRPGTRSAIRAVEAATGADVRDWLQPADGDLPSFGCGFVAGDQVVWPTRDGVRILSLDDGQQRADRDPVELRHLVSGNMVYGNGYLVVADAGRLFAYVSPGRRLTERRQEVGRVLGRPQEAAARFSLALAEADAGLPAEALADFTQVERLAGPDDLRRGQPLRDLAQQRRQEVLLHLAERAAATKRWDEAAEALNRAAAGEFPVASRLQALRRQADLWNRAGQPAGAVQVWQSVLGDEALRHSTVLSADGTPHAAATWAADRIEELVRGHGASVYAAVEQRARTLLDAAPKDEQRVAVLERLAREFPNAAVTGPALVELAALHEQAGRPGAVAEAYRLLLRRGAGVDEPAALAELARAYERQHCWEAARRTWQCLARAHGDQTLAALDPAHTVGQFVARQLDKPEFRVADVPARPDLGPPLLRRWHALLADSGECLLVPEPGPPHAGPFLFLARGHTLVCRDAATGKACWEQMLGATPCWVGRHADLVVAASADRIYGLRLADGRPLWDWHLPASYYPSSAPDAAEDTAEWQRAKLSGFQLTSARLFFLEGERRLFALDADSGRTLWQRWAPGAPVRPLYPAGRFQPYYHAGEERLVMQTSGGQRLILDSQTGRVLHRAETSPDPWPRPPRALDGQRVCLVPDSHQVVVLDLAAGKDLWTHRLDRMSSRTGEAPQVVGDRGTLLLLVPRNLGSELQRLDPRTGQTRWETLISTEAVDLETADFDATACYVVSHNYLHARSLADGKPLWRAPLAGPAGRWRTVRARNAVLAYPLETRADGPFVVVFCDLKTGEIVQRLNFPTAPAAFSPPGGEEKARPPALQIFDRGLAIVRAGDAWGLAVSIGP
jgi:outer membrane protein assembly factor BamB/tetratricopeptide (TPR) repeat protein